MKRSELLLPAGNEECLRAAVNNGADAVYLGLSRFNARQNAGNFDEKNVFSIIKYCHDRNVKVYITFNTLINNSELKDYLEQINIAYQAKCDAIIIQDPALAPIIKQNFKDIKIHLSTQATVTNSYSIPRNVDRVVLARELDFEEVKEISKDFETEVFIHGALCFCYSGQCLFSSIVGGRSGNRGLCAQPCRKKYNNRYLLSTMDLCLLEKIPELINAGIASLKIEGRMRSPIYVATAARIYRKYINTYMEHGRIDIDEKDMDDLMLAFNRNFTKGFGFEKSITDTRKPMNRGLYIGKFSDGKIALKKDLKVADGIGIWQDEEVSGYKIKNIIKNRKEIKHAKAGDEVELESYIEDAPVYKTSSVDMKIDLGDDIEIEKWKPEKRKIDLPKFEKKENNDKEAFRLFVKVYNKKGAIDADKAKADVIYYDVLKEDCADVKKEIRNAKFFVFTPRILSNEQVKQVVDKIDDVKPDGVLVSNRGLLQFLSDFDESQLHLDYSFNTYNDIDIDSYSGIPIISPELNLNEIKELKNKNFIVLVHGDILLMTTKQMLKAPELIDEDGRHFRVRQYHHVREILNSNQIGLFNKAKKYLEAGVKYFFIDLNKDTDKFIRIYRKILSGQEFDDSKIKKGYTTGYFDR